MNKIEYMPIGVIHSPFKTPEGTPIQPAGGAGVEAVVEIFPEYVEGLDDLEQFSHIILIYHFHMSKKFSLKVKPFLDDAFHGLFATRAPARPNPVGISVVRLLRVDKGCLHIQDIDMLDATPVLDVKPYIPKFDIRKVEKTGWVETQTDKLETIQDDGRFAK
ncbi:tRNA (N6-threonylcarbamoyladenosine(37)-N6)-methyltransferase TrmO [Desulfonema magnum]|uniref:Methyltransferase, TsaA-like n=1 Tax=Desulfonema magnum TaxID=45655 RepID=A0A975GM54_9BACT|nr:tRNA (N6-threonylcarbamoyladenosine(37)-N6)-methyltransferase TrmO [Desulfonema magnum]QTA85483.1 Methyltransferase, TsaA-like [Desulfonema magnum]